MRQRRSFRQDIQHAFRAFESPNYRVLFWPQSLSICGNWMQHTAIGWLVYRLTDSPAWLGGVTFLSLFPIFIFSLWAGVLGDRYPRKNILWLTNLGSLFLSLSFAYLTFTGEIDPTRIAFFCLFLGLLNAVEIPTRQAFVLDLVSQSHLQSAVALNSSVFNLARLIGPVAAGFLIDLHDESLCFALNGMLRIPILASLFFLTLDAPSNNREESENIWKDLFSGLRYVRSSEELRALLQMLAALSFLGIWFPSFLPAFAKDVVEGGPRALGYLYGATGMGSFLGAYLLARSTRPHQTGPRVAYASVCFSVGLILFSRVQGLVPAVSILFFVGLALSTQNVGVNTLVQLLAPDELRGRITSVYTVALLGVGPIGVLLAGVLAEHIGVVNTLALSGLGCLAASLWFARQVHRVVLRIDD
ncbi:MAG: MFS transporter [Candidatus Omnitrophica bacterium]|nr:MFS transporter [Candidatus Omnitrophota bacterium]MCA9427400.1 MFS transporter [Candidatus Omnitrophota bacterium]MCA9431201.1 MFS transporter [Candidatus Omnitrophota bacterium]MCA9437432.1 MFS transporter [Candidatus Omnitrophota bacterium]MCA9439454.1 MFS transporter [Candidatus Omnitrophota bacterium]